MRMPRRPELAQCRDDIVTISFKAPREVQRLLIQLAADRALELSGLTGQQIPQSAGAVLRWLITKEASARGLSVEQTHSVIPNAQAGKMHSVIPNAEARTVVLQAIRAVADGSTGLANVAVVVRGCADRLTRSQVHEVLHELGDYSSLQRAIELRPESGVGLLSEQDKALCPRGINGVVLSYVRLVELPNQRTVASKPRSRGSR